MSIESRSRQYGKVFDHWQIQEFLGSGSGGKTAVFRVVRSDSDRGASALKVVNLIEERGSLQSLPEYRRKEYEAARQACSKSAEQEVWLMDELRGNTNIVDYLDHTFVDWSDGTGFGRDMLIRMELLKDLRSDLRTGRIFREEEVLKVGRDVCTALILCHRKNILHRDVKPENIFRNKDGNYKLGDFGVSRVLDACPGAVASTGIGTYEYWPAEQMTGRYDTRVDIYSLGLVLYELSNRNRLPFAASAYANSREVSQRLSGAELPAPCDASPALARVILKACAHDPEERFPNAEAFLRALRHVSAAAAAERTRQVPEERYVTAAAANRTESSHAARRTVLEAVAAEDPELIQQETPRKKRKLWLLVPAVLLCAAALGLTMRKTGSEAPEEMVPQTLPVIRTEPAAEPTEPAEVVPETTMVPETAVPEETEVPETTDPVETEEKVSVRGIINSLELNVDIRSGPGADEQIIGAYKIGTLVEIRETAERQGGSWGCTEDGWVCMDDVYLIREQAEGEQKPLLARVNSRNPFVNIREEPNSNSKWMGSYNTGDIIEIWETTLLDSFQPWGRTDKGWICLPYVNLISEQNDEPILYFGWICLKAIPVYTEASLNAKTVGNAATGELLKIYEIRTNEGICWGRCDNGWLDLYSVELFPTDLAYSDARVVWVNNAAVYSEPEHFNQVGSYEKLTVVQIYDYEYVGNELMCRTDLGWIKDACFPNWMFWYT